MTMSEYQIVTGWRDSLVLAESLGLTLSLDVATCKIAVEETGRDGATVAYVKVEYLSAWLCGFETAKEFQASEEKPAEDLADQATVSMTEVADQALDSLAVAAKEIEQLRVKLQIAEGQLRQAGVTHGELAAKLEKAECGIYEIEADKTALRHEAERLESLLAKARKGLEFYGDHSLYESNEIAADHSHLSALIENDKGEKARKTLAVLDAARQTEEGT